MSDTEAPPADLVTAIGPGSYDHTGIVVRDFDAGMEELRASLGAEWGPSATVDATVLFADGPKTMHIRFAFTTTFPLYELVSAVDGTIFDVPGTGAIHHLSYFTDDVAAASARLRDLGYPRVMATGVTTPADAPRSRLVMHRAPYGPFIELIGYRPTHLYDHGVPWA
jgi:hypothetical protein